MLACTKGACQKYNLLVCWVLEITAHHFPSFLMLLIKDTSGKLHMSLYQSSVLLITATHIPSYTKVLISAFTENSILLCFEIQHFNDTQLYVEYQKEYQKEAVNSFIKL